MAQIKHKIETPKREKNYLLDKTKKNFRNPTAKIFTHPKVGSLAAFF